MAQKNEKKFVTDPVAVVTKYRNKKGDLKGKNKKETKMLKGICPHNCYSKKGKKKPTIFNNNDGTCICTMCGEKFPAKFYDNQELGNIVGDMKTLNNQAKYIATASDAGNDTVKFFSEVGVNLVNYKKYYKRVRKYVSTHDRIKNKKKKKQTAGSSQYGSWGRN